MNIVNEHRVGDWVLIQSDSMPVIGIVVSVYQKFAGTRLLTTVGDVSVDDVREVRSAAISGNISGNTTTTVASSTEWDGSRVQIFAKT